MWEACDESSQNRHLLGIVGAKDDGVSRLTDITMLLAAHVRTRSGINAAH
jgi:hypothetical protein